METQIQTIIEKLYDKYYVRDSTPASFVSSHWKEYFAKIKLNIKDLNVDEIKGVGFGDLQHNSYKSRFFSFITNLSYLIILKDRLQILSMVKPALKVLKKMGLTFNYDSFRQLYVALIISRYIKDKSDAKIISIGDGYGFLSALLKELHPNVQIYLVDIGKTLLFQSLFCYKAHSDKKHLLLDDVLLDKDNDNYDFVYCPAEKFLKLSAIKFDVAINIVSMQEMNEKTVSGYFSF